MSCNDESAANHPRRSELPSVRLELSRTCTSDAMRSERHSGQRGGIATALMMSAVPAQNLPDPTERHPDPFVCKSAMKNCSPQRNATPEFFSSVEVSLDYREPALRDNEAHSSRGVYTPILAPTGQGRSGIKMAKRNIGTGRDQPTKVRPRSLWDGQGSSGDCTSSGVGASSPSVQPVPAGSLPRLGLLESSVGTGEGWSPRTFSPTYILRSRVNRQIHPLTLLFNRCTPEGAQENLSNQSTTLGETDGACAPSEEREVFNPLSVVGNRGLVTKKQNDQFPIYAEGSPVRSHHPRSIGRNVAASASISFEAYPPNQPSISGDMPRLHPLFTPSAAHSNGCDGPTDDVYNSKTLRSAKAVLRMHAQHSMGSSIHSSKMPSFGRSQTSRSVLRMDGSTMDTMYHRKKAGTPSEATRSCRTASPLSTVGRFPTSSGAGSPRVFEPSASRGRCSEEYNLVGQASRRWASRGSVGNDIPLIDILQMSASDVLGDVPDDDDRLSSYFPDSCARSHSRQEAAASGSPERMFGDSRGNAAFLSNHNMLLHAALSSAGNTLGGPLCDHGECIPSEANDDSTASSEECEERHQRDLGRLIMHWTQDRKANSSCHGSCNSPARLGASVGEGGNTKIDTDVISSGTGTASGGWTGIGGIVAVTDTTTTDSSAVAMTASGGASFQRSPTSGNGSLWTGVGCGQESAGNWYAKMRKKILEEDDEEEDTLVVSSAKTVVLTEGAVEGTKAKKETYNTSTAVLRPSQKSTPDASQKTASTNPTEYCRVGQDDGEKVPAFYPKPPLTSSEPVEKNTVHAPMPPDSSPSATLSPRRNPRSVVTEPEEPRCLPRSEQNPAPILATQHLAVLPIRMAMPDLLSPPVLAPTPPTAQQQSVRGPALRTDQRSGSTQEGISFVSGSESYPGRRRSYRSNLPIVLEHGLSPVTGSYQGIGRGGSTWSPQTAVPDSSIPAGNSLSPEATNHTKDNTIVSPRHDKRTSTCNTGRGLPERETTGNFFHEFNAKRFTPVLSMGLSKATTGTQTA